MKAVRASGEENLICNGDLHRVGPADAERVPFSPGADVASPINREQSLRILTEAGSLADDSPDISAFCPDSSRRDPGFRDGALAIEQTPSDAGWSSGQRQAGHADDIRDIMGGKARGDRKDQGCGSSHLRASP